VIFVVEFIFFVVVINLFLYIFYVKTQKIIRNYTSNSGSCIDTKFVENYEFNSKLNRIVSIVCFIIDIFIFVLMFNPIVSFAKYLIKSMGESIAYLTLFSFGSILGIIQFKLVKSWVFRISQQKDGSLAKRIFRLLSGLEEALIEELSILIIVLVLALVAAMIYVWIR
jgi:hypothetical protein